MFAKHTEILPSLTIFAVLRDLFDVALLNFFDFASVGNVLYRLQISIFCDQILRVLSQ